MLTYKSAFFHSTFDVGRWMLDVRCSFFPLRHALCSQYSTTPVSSPQSLAQTGHVVSAVWLVLVCKKGSNAILKSAPGRAKIKNRTTG
jgi:hypothetical protein